MPDISRLVSVPALLLVMPISKRKLLLMVELTIRVGLVPPLTVPSQINHVHAGIGINGVAVASDTATVQYKTVDVGTADAVIGCFR